MKINFVGQSVGAVLAVVGVHYNAALALLPGTVIFLFFFIRQMRVETRRTEAKKHIEDSQPKA